MEREKAVSGHRGPKAPSIISAHLLSFLTLLLSLSNVVLGYLVFREGLTGYTSSNFYKLYAINGALLIMIFVINLVISSFVFLFTLYKLRGLSLKEFLLDWILHQDGFRFAILMILALFQLYIWIQTLLLGANDLSAQAFCK